MGSREGRRRLSEVCQLEIAPRLLTFFSPHRLIVTHRKTMNNRGDDFLSFATPQGIRTSSLPADFSILISDTLEAPATFLVTHFLARALREPRKAVLVGLSQTFDHYASILKKTVRSPPSEPCFASRGLSLTMLDSAGYSISQRAAYGEVWLCGRR